jgi:hypothetical protein
LSSPVLELDIRFERDPDNGFFADEDLVASWGTFRLSVGGFNLCEHVARRQVQEGVTWYLLPLLEWFVDNWDRLFHEPKIPSGLNQRINARQSWRSADIFDLETEFAEAAQQWWKAHSLRSAANGGIFPDVFFGVFGKTSKFLGDMRR